MSRQHLKQSPLEIIDLDVRIARCDETSSSLELLLVYLHETKESRHHKLMKSIDDLVQENGYLW